MYDYRVKQLRKFFEDTEGRVVIFQSPNLLLWGWILFRALSILLDTGKLKTGFGQLSTALLFTWAWFELTKGDSYFRRVFGGFILLFIIVGFFR